GKHPCLSLKEEWLNQKQREAVDGAITTDGPFVIWGPPGTGKTVVLALIIRELAQRGRRVLFSALTHQAVDNLLQKLLKLGWESFLRIGSPLAVDSILHPYLLDPYLAGLSTRQLKARLREVPVIATTVGTISSNSLIYSQRFDVAVIDEAGQLSEPATLIPLNRSERFLLAGDPFSLPPLVRSSAARKNRLHCSMMERLIESDSHMNRTLFLSVQYRMNQEIMAFSNSQFYQGKMVADPAVADCRLQLPSPETIPPEVFPIIDPNSPMVFVNLPTEASTDNHNPAEVEVVYQTVKGLLRGGIRGNDIGVIAPYRVQVDYVRKRIVNLDSQFPTVKGITIDTVERFQGEEREVVIISFTDTSKEGFGPCWDVNGGGRHRMNVALTRARKKLILVGDSRLLKREPFYRCLFEHCRVVSAKI
ncbi:MAG: AAA domain-containing protein, partial [Acidobacteriota bacterium]